MFSQNYNTSVINQKSTMEDTNSKKNSNSEMRFTMLACFHRILRLAYIVEKPDIIFSSASRVESKLVHEEIQAEGNKQQNLIMHSLYHRRNLARDVA